MLIHISSLNDSHLFLCTEAVAMLLPQASPSDPDNFPFVVLGNKADGDAGKSRAVRQMFLSAYS